MEAVDMGTWVPDWWAMEKPCLRNVSLPISHELRSSVIDGDQVWFCVKTDGVALVGRRRVLLCRIPWWEERSGHHIIYAAGPLGMALRRDKVNFLFSLMALEAKHSGLLFVLYVLM
ncbi:hypothetical protein E4U57_006575 [Claviceps arundinis]|uniref:Uncharacterized protein n=1 Tax=Claviceps arundinis TaxID=1623583 RepID=A0ABQ7P1P9_9HYPO|nr:hypothetical protein E4U57_006575 [Claviceps arundinis]